MQHITAQPQEQSTPEQLAASQLYLPGGVSQDFLRPELLSFLRNVLFFPHHHHLLHRKLSVSGLLSQPPFQARRPSTEVEDALEGHEHSLGVTVLPFHSPGSSAEMG